MAVISVLVFQSSPLKTCLAVDGSTCFACFTVTPANLTRHVFYWEGLLFDFAELEYLKFVAAWNKRDLPLEEVMARQENAHNASNRPCRAVPRHRHYTELAKLRIHQTASDMPYMST